MYWEIFYGLHTAQHQLQWSQNKSRLMLFVRLFGRCNFDWLGWSIGCDVKAGPVTIYMYMGNDCSHGCRW